MRRSSHAGPHPIVAAQSAPVKAKITQAETGGGSGGRGREAPR